MTQRKKYTTKNQEMVWFFIVMALITWVPLFHHSRVIGYSLFSTDGLVLFLAVFAFSIFLTLISGYFHRAVRLSLLFLAGAVTIDYFLPQADYVSWVWLVLVAGYSFFLYHFQLEALKIISAFLIAFSMSDMFVVTKHISAQADETNIQSAQVNETLSGEPIVHIVLDAFQGPNTIPAQASDAGEAVRGFLLRNGFHIYDGAYSRYRRTIGSLSAGLNFTPKPTDVRLNENIIDKTDSGFAAELLENKGLDHALRTRDTSVIVQPNFINTCIAASESSGKTKCITYQINYFPLDQMQELTRVERLTVLFFLTLRESLIYKNFRFYTPYLWGDLPETVMSPVSGRAAIPVVQRELSTLPRHSYFFYHTLATHSPFALSSDCKMRPITAWSTDDEPLTRQDREKAYSRYGEQIKCVLSELAQIFDTIAKNPNLDKAVVLIHGDHASRLSVQKRGPQMTDRDIVDNFSILFAARSPMQNAGSSSDLVALDMLLKHYLGDDAKAKLSSAGIEPYIYMDKGNGLIEKRLLPKFLD